MRYAVLADIHGNLQALTAVLEEMEHHAIDRWVVAGDLVGYGASPNECVEIVAGLGATCVAGNHDLIALGRLSEERCIDLARESLRWTREVLGAEARSFLEALPVTATAPGGLVVAHGTLDDPQRYTSTPKQARAQLAELSARPGARVLVLGHTHRPLAVSAEAHEPARGRLRLPAGEPIVLNPGAVGQAREILARARAMVLDLDAGDAAFLRLPYDVAGCRAALRAAGLSTRSCHLPPSPRRAASRLASAGLRRARRLSRGAGLAR
jgi:predicted phosphodiesterase